MKSWIFTIFTSAKEVVFSVAYVRPSVDKITQILWTDFHEFIYFLSQVGIGQSNTPLHFGDDPNHKM